MSFGASRSEPLEFRNSTPDSTVKVSMSVRILAQASLVAFMLTPMDLESGSRRRAVASEKGS